MLAFCLFTVVTMFWFCVIAGVLLTGAMLGCALQSHSLKTIQKRTDKIASVVGDVL